MGKLKQVGSGVQYDEIMQQRAIKNKPEQAPFLV
jgi:hypothetical protein